MVTRKGLGQANILRTNNNTSTGYGVAYADEVSGHRTVGSLADLYVLHDWQLSASGNNTDNDAIGQLWYVVNADGNGNGCYYQLKDWSKRNEAAGWSIADYTTKAELQDKIDNIATADEEDITAEGNIPQTQVLKLKDRAYDSLNASGKGYKILRKNWQSINGERKNVLTQAMINEPNTIYEIRYDFDLNGAEIQIKEGCVLNFAGGNLSNGTINGNNAIIKSFPYLIFNNIIFKGNFIAENAYCEWFNGKGNGIDDDSSSIQLSLNIFNTVKLLPLREYKINKTIIMPARSTIISDRGYIIGTGDIELIKMGWQCSLFGIIIKLDKPCDVISIESEHIYNTKQQTKSDGNAYIRIDNIQIISPFSVYNESINSKCIKIIANGHGAGFWNVVISKVQIFGRFIYSIYVDTGVDATANVKTYANDLTFSEIKIQGSKNGFYFGSNNESEDSKFINSTGASKIQISDCSMQFYSDFVERFCIAELCENVNITDCQPWDWVLSKYKAYKFYNKSRRINVRHSTFSQNNYIEWINNNEDSSDPHIDICYKEFESDLDAGGLIAKALSDYITYNPGEKMTKKQAFYLPQGIYELPYGESISTFLGIGVAAINKGILKVSKSITGTLLEYIPNMGDIWYRTKASSFSTLVNFAYNRDKDFDGPLNPWLRNMPFPVDYTNTSTLLTNTNENDVMAFLNNKLVRVSNGKIVDLSDGRTNILNSVESTSLPNSLDNSKDIGKSTFNKTINKPIYWNGTEWMDSNGISINIKRKGTTTQRPTLSSADEGFEYYDSTLKKKVLWNGTAWVNMDGSSLGEQPTPDNSL